MMPFLELMQRSLSRLVRAWNFFWYVYLGNFGRQDSIIDGRVRICGIRFISTGSGLVINDGVRIQASANGKCIIGNDVTISYGVMILTGGLAKPGDKDHIEQCVSIGDRVWLGAGCIVLPGAVIPSDTIIGAGAIVSKSGISSGGVYVGPGLRRLR